MFFLELQDRVFHDIAKRQGKQESYHADGNRQGHSKITAQVDQDIFIAWLRKEGLLVAEKCRQRLAVGLAVGCSETIL